MPRNAIPLRCDAGMISQPACIEAILSSRYRTSAQTRTLMSLLPVGCAHQQPSVAVRNLKLAWVNVLAKCDNGFLPVLVITFLALKLRTSLPGITFNTIGRIWESVVASLHLGALTKTNSSASLVSRCFAGAYSAHSSEAATHQLMLYSQDI